MPGSPLGIYDPALPLYGLPQPRQRLWTPRLVQSATNTQGNQTGIQGTLASRPTPGNLIVVAAASIENAPTPSIVGCSVGTWRTVATTGVNTGAQTRIVLFIGMAGETRERVCNVTIQNNSGLIIAEFDLQREASPGGVAGNAFALSKASTTNTAGSGNMSLTSIVNPTDNAMMFWAHMYTASTSPTVPGGLWNVITRTFGSGASLRLGYLLIPIKASGATGTLTFTGATNNQAGLAGIVW